MNEMFGAFSRYIVNENEMFFILLVQFLISLFEAVNSLSTRVAANVIKFQSLCFLIFGFQKALALMLFEYHSNSLFSDLSKSSPLATHDTH
jgi:hypothetical protein